MKDRDRAYEWLTSGCEGCGMPVGGVGSCDECFDGITALLAEVRTEEREACAEVCEVAEMEWSGDASSGAASLSERIRARTP